MPFYKTLDLKLPPIKDIGTYKIVIAIEKYPTNSLGKKYANNKRGIFADKTFNRPLGASNIGNFRYSMINSLNRFNEIL